MRGDGKCGDCLLGIGHLHQCISPKDGVCANGCGTCVMPQVGAGRSHVAGMLLLIPYLHVDGGEKSGISIRRCMLFCCVANHVCFIHKSVTISCKIVGASNNCPCRPSLSCMSYPVTCNKNHMRSCGWLENFSNVWMCASVCSV